MKPKLYWLKVSEKMEHEWSVRCIGDVIPGLIDQEADAKGFYWLPIETVMEIRRDCEFYLHPYGPETTIGERSAYRALCKQCVYIEKVWRDNQ